MFGKPRGAPSIKLTQIASLIAEGVEIDGDLAFRGGLRIDGCLRGRLVGRRGEGEPPALLVLSPSGRIEGSVHCGHALINGHIDGDVVVEEFLELQATARITGTLRYRQLQMDLGAVVQGQMIHLDAAPAPVEAARVNLMPEPRVVAETR